MTDPRSPQHQGHSPDAAGPPWSPDNPAPPHTQGYPAPPGSPAYPPPGQPQPYGAAGAPYGQPPYGSPPHGPAQPQAYAQPPDPPLPPPAHPQPGLWAPPASTIDLSAPPVGVPGAPGAPRRRRRVPILVAASVVVVLLLGGGAVAAVRAWYGTGKQPEQVLPASTVAFGRLDLSPGLGQGKKLSDLVQKFPGNGGDDPIEDLKRRIIKGFDADERAYREHIEPWFANRIGIGLWLDSRQRPYVLLAAASDDDAAARTGLAALRDKGDRDETGFVVDHGYALIAGGDEDAQAAAEAAAAEAGADSLADAAPFRTAVNTLPDRQTLLVWADLAKVSTALESLLDLDDAGGPALLGAVPQLTDLKGTFVIGAQPTSSGVEVRLRGLDNAGPVPAPRTDPLTALGKLPGNSSAAAVLAAGDAGDGLAKQFSTPDGLGLPTRQGDLDPDGLGTPDSGQLRESLNALSDALKALSGATVSVALTGFGGEIPALLAAADTSSSANAGTLAEALQAFGDVVKVDRQGNRVELSTSGYAPRDGKLADKALYREAMADMPDGASAAVYLDVQKAMAESDASAEDKRQAKPLKAVGFGLGMDGTDPVALLRIVIK